MVVTPTETLGRENRAQTSPVTEQMLAQVRATPGVAEAAGSIFTPGTFLDMHRKRLTTGGAPAFGVQVKLPIAKATRRPSLVAGSDDRREWRQPSMYINAKPVQEAELATKVSELLENKAGGEKIVIIRADEEVEYGAVIGGDGPAAAGWHRGHRLDYATGRADWRDVARSRTGRR